MKVNTVINHIQSSCQEVSVYWNDEFSQRFHSKIILEMNNLLNSFNSTCIKLENDTSSALSRIASLENI